MRHMISRSSSLDTGTNRGRDSLSYYLLSTEFVSGKSLFTDMNSLLGSLCKGHSLVWLLCSALFYLSSMP